MDLLNVAKFYNTNPADVERWAITDFNDRLEFMHLYKHINKYRGEGDLEAGKKPWAGPSDG